MPEPPHRSLPLDRLRSPMTGWTREHWIAHADRLLTGAEPHASPSFARFRLPGRPSSLGTAVDELQAFAHLFMLAALRVVASGGQGVPDLIERYAAGLTAGTDPYHREAWPRLPAGRATTAAAGICVALHETRPWLWDRLDERTRHQVVDWMAGTAGQATPRNHEALQQTLAQEFLASVGAPHRHHTVLRGLDFLEDWYLGEGWYSDGAGRRIDHANAWALHLYPLLWSRVAQAGPRAAVADALGAIYRERLFDYLRDYPYLLGADGSFVHFGSGLTQRLAGAAPLWTGALFDCTPLRPGQTRHAASAVMRYFDQRDAPDHAGLLRMARHGEPLDTVHRSEGPAAPYSAWKGFLGLLLPATHPVWTTPEEALPVEHADTVRALTAPNLLLHTTAVDGIARMHNHGSDGLPPGRPAMPSPQFARIAYSSATAPVTSPLEPGTMPDNQLTLLSRTGDPAGSGPIHPLGAGTHDRTGYAASWYQPRQTFDDDVDLPVPEARVETHTVVAGHWEVRLYAVTAPVGWQLRASGYSLADALPKEAVTGHAASGLFERWAAVRSTAGLVSAVAPLLGFHAHGTHTQMLSDAYGPHPTVPYLVGRHTERTQVYAACVVLSGDALDLTTPPPVRVSVQDNRVTVDLNGHTHRWHRSRTAGAQPVLRYAGPCI